MSYFLSMLLKVKGKLDPVKFKSNIDFLEFRNIFQDRRDRGD